MIICVALAASAPVRWLLGSGRVVPRRLLARRRSVPVSPSSAVEEYARPKAFSVPRHCSVYTLLTLDKIYMILPSSAREMEMTKFDLAAFTAQARANHAASLVRPEVWQLPDGTWAHRFDAKGGFADRGTAEIDLRFSKEWGRK